MNPNDPAFPVTDVPNLRMGAPGMSLRADLAGRAMQGFLSNKAIMEWVGDTFEGKEIEIVAKLSVTQADYLIAELNRESPLSPCDAFNKEMSPKLAAHKSDMEKLCL